MASSNSNSWIIGVALDAVATLTGTIGKQLLRYAALKRNVIYYPIGFFFTAFIDPAFDVAAYSFAAASIITACAGLVIVWNVLLAPCTLGEPLTAERKLSAVLICIGTILTGVFGSHEEASLTLNEYLALFSRPAACAYYVLLAIVLLVLARLSVSGRLEARGFYVSALAGLLAGNTFTTKASVELLDCVLQNKEVGCDENPFLTMWPYLLLCGTLLFSGGSLLILALALRDSEALMAITVFEGCMIIAGVFSGNLVLDEISGQTARGLAGYTLSLAIIMAGLAVLIRGELGKGAQLF